MPPILPAAAFQEFQACGLPPLPITTPHTLRRTYISIALLTNGFDVKWVMSQVGHGDSKMPLTVPNRRVVSLPHRWPRATLIRR